MSINAIGVAVGTGVGNGIGVAVGTGVGNGIGVAVGTGVGNGIGVAVGTGVAVGYELINLENSFIEFINKTPPTGKAIICVDNRNIRKILKKVKNKNIIK